MLYQSVDWGYLEWRLNNIAGSYCHLPRPLSWLNDRVHSVKTKISPFFQTNPIFIIKHTLTCTITYRHNHLIFQYLAYVEFVKLTSSDLIRTFFYCTKIKLGFGTRSNLDCPLPRPPSPNRLIKMYFILYLISHRHCISIYMHS